MTTKAHDVPTKFTVALVFLLLLLSTTYRVEAQQPTTQTPRIRVIEYSGDLLNFLSAISQSYDVTIGFEVDRNEPHSHVTVSLKDPTIEDVMNAIVRSKPNYTWRMTSKAIEVLPQENADSFLDAIIPLLHVENVPPSEALKQLMALTEVTNAFKQSKISTSTAAAKRTPPITFDLRGATIREVLDHIASNSGQKFWLYKRFSDRPNEIEITIASK